MPLPGGVHRFEAKIRELGTLEVRRGALNFRKIGLQVVYEAFLGLVVQIVDISLHSEPGLLLPDLFLNDLVEAATKLVTPVVFRHCQVAVDLVYVVKHLQVGLLTVYLEDDLLRHGRQLRLF